MGSSSVLVISVILTVVLLSLQLHAVEANTELAVEARATPQLDPTCSLPYPAVFVNPQNGTQNNSCWSEGQDQPCGSLPYAIQGAVQKDIPVVLSPGLYQTNGSCVCDNVITHCNTWFQEEHGKCVCGDSVNSAVRCDPETMSIKLRSCYCMTYDKVNTKIVYGSCPNGCFSNIFRPIPVDPHMINERMCGYFNRSGQLCGECKEGYYQPAYSYEIACVQCTYHPYNWVLYALAAFGPLTVFYIIILVFRINAASPPLTGIVQFCQLLTNPNILRSLIIYFHSRPQLFGKEWVMKLPVTIYSVWNLDFFRMILPPICLHLNGLQLIAIDYAIACYPMLLVILTYVLIELHDRNVRVVVWFLKPFRACLSFLGLHQRDMKSSVISTFASFILLSYVKFLSVSSDLLLPTRVHDMNGTTDWYLYYLPTVKYFSAAHLPYALTAIAVLLIFIFTPLLLVLLYPFRWFQWLLGYCQLHSHALQTFMDAFQGYLKDGTNGTQDCRHFAAAYLTLRIIGFITYGFIRSQFFWSLVSLFVITVGLVVVVLRPYKTSVYNTIDGTLLLVLAMWCISMLSLHYCAYNFPQAKISSVALALFLGLVPLLWSVIAIACWIIIKKCPQRLMGRIRAWWRTCKDWHKNVRYLCSLGPVQLDGDDTNVLSNHRVDPDCYQLIELDEFTK